VEEIRLSNPRFRYGCKALVIGAERADQFAARIAWRIGLLNGSMQDGAGWRK
jgi:hypothetical protein